MPGLIEFYLGRVSVCKLYGIRGGSGILETVIVCVEHDYHTGMLTRDDYRLIMKACDDLFYEFLTEVTYNERFPQ